MYKKESTAVKCIKAIVPQKEKKQVKLLFDEVGGRTRVCDNVGVGHQKSLFEFIDAVFNVRTCF